MRELSPTGERIIGEIAERHGFSMDAVKEMLDAVARGGGTMAQFNHPEFGGGGQWLRGGMTMIGDMFNNQLKGRVDALASELSALVGNAPGSGEMYARPSQAQSQGGGHDMGGGGAFATWQSQSGGNWWPEDLGTPSSVGSQNDMRYAYFPDKRRLALSRGGQVEVLDTGEHNITGFGQQQGGNDGITLSSQLGTVPLSSLRRIQATAQAAERPSAPDFAGAGPAAIPAAESATSRASGSDAASILSLLEKLGELRDKDVLSEEEFAIKKAELLKRL